MTRDQVVAAMLSEFGKSGVKTAEKISMWVGDITIDLLSRNDGRFSGLHKTKDITIVTTDDHYKLPTDYNTADKNFYEFDSTGAFIRKLAIISKADWLDRKSQAKYAASRVAYIEKLQSYTNAAGAKLGRGYYLILGAKPDTTGFYSFPYYRRPIEDDTDLIRNHEIVKVGVRGKAVEFNPNHARDKGEYGNRRAGFRERANKHITQMITRPSHKIQRLNRKMGKIGSGL